MPEIQKVSYSHDAVIDEMLANPQISQGELAKHFGYTQSWMSIIMNSGAFKERYLQRKEEIVDPVIRARLAENSEKAVSAASRALDRILERLESPVAAAQMKTADLVTIAKFDVAPKNAVPAISQNNLYVVNLPPAAANSADWLKNSHGASRAPAPMAEIVENQTGV